MKLLWDKDFYFDKYNIPRNYRGYDLEIGEFAYDEDVAIVADYEKWVIIYYYGFTYYFDGKKWNFHKMFRFDFDVWRGKTYIPKKEFDDSVYEELYENADKYAYKRAKEFIRHLPKPKQID